ncbi:hypothetical protein IQ07DRAFT_586331 [Pyrenochaeta sp. DS3sAY3a]|nr:hypothetical protein IQ07DRAFT_586331 [Pyrenochaeta sp. DS3sAY3a]
MPSVETPAVSASGITTSATGERHIPASVRPDGSVRKEIRVRPGYRPPEDVEVYRNKATEAFRNRGKAGVPGAEGLKSAEALPKPSAAASKNAKRKEARKKAAAAASDDKDDAKLTEIKNTSAEATEAAKPAEVNPQAETEKEVKKLLKKLRQAGELKAKKENGDKLLPEQFEKIIKMNELIRQLEALNYNAQGEKISET